MSHQPAAPSRGDLNLSAYPVACTFSHLHSLAYKPYARHRRIDYSTGRTYHLPPDGPAALGPEEATKKQGAAAAASAAAAAAAAAAAPVAYSEAIRPLCADGSVDKEVMGRLEVRHDDSDWNVARRLALWDQQVGVVGLGVGLGGASRSGVHSMERWRACGPPSQSHRSALAAFLPLPGQGSARGV